jgi:hypothetical protein
MKIFKSPFLFEENATDFNVNIRDLSSKPMHEVVRVKDLIDVTHRLRDRISQPFGKTVKWKDIEELLLNPLLEVDEQGE